MANTKPKQPTRAQLARRVIELQAQLTYSYHAANLTIGKASTDYMTGSGVLLQLTHLGGKEVINPVVIKDGLSLATIDAIKADLKRSYDLSVLFKVQ